MKKQHNLSWEFLVLCGGLGKIHKMFFSWPLTRSVWDMREKQIGQRADVFFRKLPHLSREARKQAGQQVAAQQQPAHISSAEE